MIGKAFFPKQEFEKLRANIKQEGHERIYDDNRSRRHRTDGFIFTPNEAYNAKGTPNLYKWKYSDLVSITYIYTKHSHKVKLSIDFRILPDRHGRLELACGGSESSLIRCRTMELSPDDEATVMRIIESNRVLRGFEIDPHYSWLNSEHGAVILEMTYDARAGVWKFHVERSDKNTPNYISIVFDTMEAIAENVTEREICYRIPLTPEEDQWEDQ